jgi:hypothetical protein
MRPSPTTPPPHSGLGGHNPRPAARARNRNRNRGRPNRPRAHPRPSSAMVEHKRRALQPFRRGLERRRSAPYHCERAPIPPAAAYGFEKSYGSDPQIVNEEYGVTDGVSLLRRAEWNPKEIRTNRYFRTEAACRLALQADLDKEAARTRADAADKKAEDRTLDSYR